MIGVVGLVAVLALLAGAAVSVSTALARSWIFGRVSRMGLDRRLRALELICAAPLLALVVVPALCLLPSVFSLAVPSMDHCLHHTDHPFHLCFVHLPAVPMAATLFGVGLLLVVFVRIAGRGLRQATWSSRTSAQLRSVGRADDQLGVELLAGGVMAFTLGLSRPRVFISEALRRALTTPQWSVLLAHERAHQDRRDPLRRWVMRTAAVLHMPATARMVLDLHALAVEQRCDEVAAERTGDRLLVAETLLAVARLAEPAPAAGLGIGESNIEARVHALIETPSAQRQRPAVPRVALVVAGAILAATPLHHAAEHLLGHLL